MPGRTVAGLLLAAFSIAVGHLAWNALLGPPLAPTYFVGGRVRALAGTDPEAKQLYLRRKLYLNQRPRHAWLQVLGRDEINVYVNGSLLVSHAERGTPVALLADPTPLLRSGTNIIAIQVRQDSLDWPPLIAIDGGYTQSDGTHPIQSDPYWRCGTTFERGAAWWFQVDFEDHHWPFARLQTQDLRARVPQPPNVLRSASAGSWLTPANLRVQTAAVRREFTVEGRPRWAWLRVVASSSYSLAVNGIIIDEYKHQVGTRLPVVPLLRTYDITTVARRGRNVVALRLSSPYGPPHVLADAEIQDQDGRRVRLATDRAWVSCPGPPADWLKVELDNPSTWRPCVVEAGDVGIPPWKPEREAVAISLPSPVIAWRAFEEVGAIVFVWGLTLLACKAAGRILGNLRGGGDRATGARVAYLALVPATLAIAGGLLATYDPRVGRQDLYRGSWVALALLSVPLQWALLAILARREGREGPSQARLEGIPWAPLARGASLVGLVVVGLALRVSGMTRNSIQADEVTMYRSTQGLLQRGFPSCQVHEDLPIFYTSTDELVYYGTALSSLIFQGDRMILRAPSVWWGTLTIVLMFAVGRRLFGPAVGLVAAAIYAVSPFCIQMANWGRYPSQLQFVTLVTLAGYWCTIDGKGPINRRMLWITTVGFIATFLTWEGAALIAPPMIVAALVRRRGHLRGLLADFQVWAAIALVGGLVLLQFAHRALQQNQRPWYGSGASEATLMPMWRYPVFDIQFYIRQASWNRDALLPMLLLLAAALLTTRHGFREPARFLMLIFLGCCGIMSLLLSLKVYRYSYFMTPLLILLDSAALVAAARGLSRLAGRPGAPRAWRAFARGIAGLMVLVVLTLSSGIPIELSELPEWSSYSLRFRDIKFPDLDGPVAYLRANLRAGDIVISTTPHVVDHRMASLGGDPRGTERTVDHWLQTTLYLQAVLDDRRPLPLHRLCGTPMIASKEALEDLFARHRRIWYVLVPAFHEEQNTTEVSAFVRQHMEVAYESYSSLVLLRGDRDRSTAQRAKDEQALFAAKANFLP